MGRPTAVLAALALVVLAGPAAAQDEPRAPPPPASSTAAAPPAESPPPPASSTAAAPPAESPPPPEPYAPVEPYAAPPALPPARVRQGIAPRSDWFVGIDASVGPLPGVTAHLVGAALLARFGYRYDREQVFVSPEAALGLVEIAGDIAGQGFHTETVWIGAGARAGLHLGPFQPALFSHAYIWFSGGGDYINPGAGGRGSPAIDLGAAFDLRLTGSVVIGPHLAVVFVPGHEDATFGIAGLHVDLMR